MAVIEKFPTARFKIACMAASVEGWKQISDGRVLPNDAKPMCEEFGSTCGNTVTQNQIISSALIEP